ncbi:MAG: cation:proton antiporter [Acidobacteriota bacterium]|nr:cation:proton antiporter [Acidobacteriota bacterium]
MQENPLTIPLSLLVIFVSAKAMAEIFERVSLPGIVGEILAGVLVGPQVLGWMAPNTVLSAFSDLGLIFLLFRVGLEVKSSELMKVGGTALAVAVSGVIVPFAMGWAILRAWHAPQIEAIFVGVAMVATSVGITAEVLKRLGVLQSRAARIILAAAVFDDILGLLALSVASSIARGGFNLPGIALTAVLAVGFTVIVAHWGSRFMQHLMPRLHPRLNIPETEFSLAMCLLFGLSVLAVWAGVAAITGAFLAGMAMSESVEQRAHDLTAGVAEVFLPFFLAGIGMHLDLITFRKPETLILTGAIVLAAIVSKLIGCGLGALSLGWRDAWRVGTGMIPRGEVGMVVAQIGVGFGVIAQPVYGVIVAMSVLTTLVAPWILRFSFRKAESEAGS